MASAEEEGRKKAIDFYRILAAIHGFLGVGLLVSGYYGTKYAGENEFGPPFYLGGFLVGSVVMISALLCVCILSKGGGAMDEIKKREVACCMMGQYSLAMFAFMFCFIGLIFAGLGACSSYREDVCKPERDTVRYAIVGLLVAAVLANILSIYIVCTYGSFFGVVLTQGRRGRAILILDQPHGAGITTDTLATNNLGVNVGGMQQLQRQNELLQQQLQLQQQLNQQNQFGRAYLIPPPPSYNRGT